MQHRYVPDLGDFSKFAVIDALSGRGKLKTALIWYLVDPTELKETHNNDGKHTTYLHRDRQGIGACHPQLYERFQSIHATGEKHVGIYPRFRVLANINYFDEPLSYADQSVMQRLACRRAWLDRAMLVAKDADLVMLDPDNGLCTERIALRSNKAVKYASLDECAAFYGRGERTLIVYQHAHRQGSATEQADQALRRLTQHLGVDRCGAFALRFHRGSTRFYLVVPAADQTQAMHDRASSLINSAWGTRNHFSRIQ